MEIALVLHIIALHADLLINVENVERVPVIKRRKQRTGTLIRMNFKIHVVHNIGTISRYRILSTRYLKRNSDFLKRK